MATSEGPLANYTSRDLFGHKKRVTTLGWSSSGRKLASGSYDSTVRIWAVQPYASKSEVAEVVLGREGGGSSGVHTGALAHLAWKPGSESVLASTTTGSSTDKSIRFWDARSGKCSGSVSSSNCAYLSWSPDGSSVVGINTDNVLSIVDVRKCKTWKTHKFNAEVFTVHWGPTNQQIMVDTDKGSVNILALPSLEVLWQLQGHTSNVFTFSTCPKYRYLASGGGDALVALWDLEDMVCVRTWRHMESAVRSTSLSFDGSMLACSTDQGEIDVLSTVTGERLAGLSSRVQCDCLSWSPTANILAYPDEVMDTNSRDRAMLDCITLLAAPKPSS